MSNVFGTAGMKVHIGAAASRHDIPAHRRAAASYGTSSHHRDRAAAVTGDRGVVWNFRPSPGTGARSFARDLQPEHGAWRS